MRRTNIKDRRLFVSTDAALRLSSPYPTEWILRFLLLFSPHNRIFTIEKETVELKLPSLPVPASVTLAVLVMMVVVMAFLFTVMVFTSSRFWVDIGDDHFTFITDYFAVTGSIVRIVQRFFT